MKQRSFKQRKKPSFILPPSLSPTQSDSRHDPSIVSDLAKSYHALACGMKHSAKQNMLAAVEHVQEARDALVQTYQEGQAQVDRSRKVLGVADAILNQASEDESEASHYLKETNFIAAKYHATALRKENAAETAKREAQEELEKMRYQMELDLVLAQEELDKARESKAVADFELKNATQEVEQSRKFLSQLAMDDDVSVATECVETDKADVVMSFDDEAASAVAAVNDDEFISGSNNGTAKYWSISSGECNRTFKGHTARINSVAVTSERQFVTASDDRTIKLWDLSFEICVHTFTGHTDRVLSVATGVGVDGFISGSCDKTIKWWSLSGACERTFKGHSGIVYSVAVLRKDRVISASADKSIRLWNTQTGRCVRKFKGHSAEVCSVAAIDRDRFISGSRDGTVRLWDSSSAKTIRKLKLNAVPTAVASVGTEQRFVAIAYGRNLCLWNLWSDVRSRDLEGHKGKVMSVASMGDNGFASASQDETIKVWDLLAVADASGGN